MYENELQQLGLSDKEAKTYMAALELGSAAAQEIAKRAGLKRPTAYFAIEKLTELGLMSSFEKGKKRYFSAESPERLMALVGSQRRKAVVLEEELQRILPELNNLFRISGEKPRVRFFEGKEGIKAIQEDILKSKVRELEEIYPLDDFLKLFSAAERKPYILKRKRKKIKARAIYTSKTKNVPASPNAELRFVPYNKFPFSADIVIYGNKVAIATYKGKLMSVIIESREIAETLRLVFNLAWEAAVKK